MRILCRDPHLCPFANARFISPGTVLVSLGLTTEMSAVPMKSEDPLSAAIRIARAAQTRAEQHAGAHYCIDPQELLTWLRCRRCAFDSIRNGIALPRTWDPDGVDIDTTFRDAVSGFAYLDIAGTRMHIIEFDRIVESDTLLFESLDVTITLRGTCDALVRTERDELYVAEFKATVLPDCFLQPFRFKLGALSSALANPSSAIEEQPLVTSGIGLLVLDPSNFALSKKSGNGGLFGPTRWVELRVLDDQLIGLLYEIAQVLIRPVPPEPAKRCEICRIRALR